MARRLLTRSLAVILLPVIGYFDYLSGLEVNVSTFYFLPIALMAWRKGRTLGLLMAGCCAIVWSGVDHLSGFPYSSPLSPLWNAIMRFAAFGLIAVLVGALRTTNNTLRQTVEDLQLSAQRIKELQAEMQVVCAWSNRIRSEGKWVRFEQFMSDNFQLTFTHGMSEDALEKVRQEAASAAATAAGAAL